MYDCFLLLHRSKISSVQNYRVYPKEMLEALGLSQVVTKRKPLKLGEMVPNFLQKSTTA